MLTLQSTAEEATDFLRARDRIVKSLSGMSKARLAENAEARSKGIMKQAEYMRWSKDELITNLLWPDYSAEQINLANHIRYQASGVECSDACIYHDLCSCCGGSAHLAPSDGHDIECCDDTHGYPGQTFAEHSAASVAAIAEASK